MALNFANNNSLSAITTLPASVSGGAMTLLATQTASSSANVSFTSGIDDTYDEYVFKFIDIHPASQQHFQFNVSIDGGSNYNVAKTTTTFGAYHTEADDATSLNYKTSQDLAQGTGYQILSVNGQVGADADNCFSGTLQLFNPSSTTFVKHFISSSNHIDGGPTSLNAFVAGYANTTSAVNAVNFQMASGNIDSGVIKLYGVS